jgi:hypothetical protein
MRDRGFDPVTLALARKGGGGGTGNYNDLSNKPKIGGHTLEGNMDLEDIGDVPIDDSDIEDAVRRAFGLI